ncbi:hypothetical protein [Polyangium sp. y55x31]|uniref:hypothetical protein n=1 Tax=Polyangium sp. y55x31 TaxID=3042688 RepID=UPI002482B007|nr:hypothetical protein [Polyangium sp. y55x31]
MQQAQRSKIPRAQGVTPPDDVRQAVGALVSTIGERAALESLNISRQTLARVTGGLPVRVGTLVLVRQQLQAHAHKGGSSA